MAAYSQQATGEGTMQTIDPDTTKVCPYCSAESLRFCGGPQYDSTDYTKITQTVDCTVCGKSWFNIYKLVNHKEI